MSNEPSPAYLQCAMEAHEEGIRPEDIVEECACRMAYAEEAATTPVFNLNQH